MLPWKRNNSATLWTAQEAASYLQRNCRNQNQKTFLSLLAYKLVSLFYRSTCVRTHNHGYELFFSSSSSPYTPPFSPCPLHMHVFRLFALLLADRLTLPLHTPRCKMECNPRASLAARCPASCCQPRSLGEEGPAKPRLLLATTMPLTPWLWTHLLQSPETPPAMQGWSRSARG